MRYVLAILAFGLAIGFCFGFLVGSEVAVQPVDLSQCKAASVDLGQVFDLSRDREVVRLENGMWCVLK